MPEYSAIKESTNYKSDPEEALKEKYNKVSSF